MKDSIIRIRVQVSVWLFTKLVICLGKSAYSIVGIQRS